MPRKDADKFLTGETTGPKDTYPYHAAWITVRGGGKTSDIMSFWLLNSQGR